LGAAYTAGTPWLRSAVAAGENMLSITTWPRFMKSIDWGTEFQMPLKCPRSL